MIITIENFEDSFLESLRRLDAYIASRKTEGAILDAKHRKYTVERNKNFYAYCVEKGEKLYLCKSCGSMEAAHFVENTKKRMLEKQVCFVCDLWDERAANKNRKEIIANGHLYSDGGRSGGRKSFLGFGGAEVQIEKNGKTWTTNNLWSGGTIPEEFRDRLADNAIIKWL